MLNESPTEEITITEHLTSIEADIIRLREEFGSFSDEKTILFRAKLSKLTERRKVLVARFEKMRMEVSHKTCIGRSESTISHLFSEKYIRIFLCCVTLRKNLDEIIADYRRK